MYKRQELLGAQADAAFRRQLAGLDRCIVGMALQIGVYFGIDDARIDRIVENLLSCLLYTSRCV